MRTLAVAVAAAVTVCGVPCGGSEEDAARAARLFLDRGDFTQAVGYFETAVAKKPPEKDLRLLYAFSYFSLERFGKAEEWLKKEVETNPGGADALCLLGLVYYRQGRGADAEAACRESSSAFANKGLEHRPLVSGWDASPESLAREKSNAALPYFILGLLDKNQKRFDEAIGHFGKAWELGYDPLACHLHILDAERGRLGWDRIMELGPKLTDRGGGVSAEARTFQAIALDEKGLDQEALDCLTQAAALKPLAPWAIKNIAIFHLNRGRFEESLPLIKKALRVAPQDFQSRFLLEQAEGRRQAVDRTHRLALSTDFLDTVVPVYRHAFARDPKAVAREVQNYALELIRAGMIADAALVLKNFLALYDLSPSLNYNLAQLYNSAGRYPDALRYGLRAIELQPDSRDAHDLVANILFKTWALEEAAEFYRRAVALAPNDALAYYNLGCAQRALKDDGEAERNWQAAVRWDGIGQKTARGSERARPTDDLHIDLQVRAEPVSYDAWVSLGALYSEQKKLEAALDAFGKASEILPQRQEPYFEMGRIYVDLDDREMAKSCFQKYISLGGDEAKVKALLR